MRHVTPRVGRPARATLPPAAQTYQRLVAGAGRTCNGWTDKLIWQGVAWGAVGMLLLAHLFLDSEPYPASNWLGGAVFIWAMFKTSGGNS